MLDLVADLDARDARLVRRAVATLNGNLLAGARYPWHPLRGICPSPTTYAGVWNWDAAFHAVGVARLDPVLAREQIRIVLDAQLATGQLPDVIYADGRVVSDFGKPPVMAWAVQIVDLLAPDTAFLEYAYPRLAANEAFWRRERGGEHEGLFHYDSAGSDRERRSLGARYESGWDDSPRWDGGVRQRWPVDLNCYLVSFYRALTEIAARIGRPDPQWREKELALADAVDTRLWDETRGAYVDYDFRAHTPSAILSPASFMPLYTRIASPGRAARLAALASDENTFFPGFPTVSYDDPAYSDRFWRGPRWLNVAYFALKGLLFYGYDTIAGAVRDTILEDCARNREAIYEYYDARTGRGLGAQQFGWSAVFLIELILNWSSDSVY